MLCTIAYISLPTTTTPRNPMKLAKTFLINLSGTACQIEAMISFTSYIITDVIALDGFPVDFGEDEMEVFEAHVESCITATTIEALDLDTFKPTRFEVHAIDGVILAIEHESGHVVERNSATFSEVSEAWHLDRQFNEAVESDQPGAAHVAGYLHLQPVPSPQQAGHGYRRAA